MKTATETLYEEMEKDRVIREQEHAVVLGCVTMLHMFGIRGDEAEQRIMGGYTVKELEQMVVSGFWEDENPSFRDGPPRHELEEPITASVANHMVNTIIKYRTALEKIYRVDGCGESANIAAKALDIV